MNKFALRIDDIGSSTKKFEVYSKKKLGNFLFLKYLKGFKAWGTSREMSVEEWNEGHLSLAKNIEWQDIGIEIQEVALVKEQRIIVYCRSGKRAGKAFITLTDLGYTNVINAGGLNDAQKLLGGDIVK